LLVNLTDAQVTALGRAAHEAAPVRWWIADLATPRLLERLKTSWNPALAAASAPMPFAPPDSPAFFDGNGWREAEFHSTWLESLRLTRSMRMARLWYGVSRFMKAETRRAGERRSGMSLFERR
jgi:hypothetical protein